MSETADGLEYTVESVLPVMTSPTSRPPTRHPGGAERHLALPADFLTELADQARLITAGASTVRAGHRLAELVPGFVYDLSFPAGHSQSAMLEFVAQRRGYRAVRRLPRPRQAMGCPAGSRSVSPRAAGADGRYYVRGKHAHAGRRSISRASAGCRSSPPRAGVRPTSSTGVPAAQADNGGD